MQVRSPKDFVTGLLFIAVGCLGLWVGQDYHFGSALRMGPGYLPVVLSIGVIVIGLLVAIPALVIEGPPIEAGSWLPVLMISLAMIAFGLLIERAGLVIATSAAVLLGSLASTERRPAEVLLAALLLPAFCAVVFVWALGQPIPLWPGR